MGKRKIRINELDGFHENDIVEIINPKSKYYKKIGVISRFKFNTHKAVLVGIYSDFNSVPLHWSYAYKLEQLKIIKTW